MGAGPPECLTDEYENGRLDETEWQRFTTPEVLFDNLIADGEAVPMIVVMPNGRAQRNDRAEGDVFASVPHVWHVDEHGRDPAHWRNSLHHFAQRLFK